MTSSTAKHRGVPALGKICARRVVDFLLRSRGTQLPPYFHLRDRISYLMHGLEPSVTKVAKLLLSEGDVVVDVGANVGFLTRTFAEFVGTAGRVFAFEPDPATYECLAFNTRNLPQVHLSRLALSDRNEFNTLYLHPTSGMSNSLVNVWENAHTLEVECSTFDAWAATAQPGPIRMVKIDVEGAEAHVLRGMSKTFRNNPEIQLIMEFCPKNLGSRAAEEAVLDLLRSGDFRIHIIATGGTLRLVIDPQEIYDSLNENGYANLLCRGESAMQKT
ncbi:MAG: FkbM family methyltransferase [Chthoniobacterales bacterium]|nr:FkbM family methyltransferase [Chthoniobacterales bacterium]